MSLSKITVETTVEAPIDVVWESWTSPEHIVEWNQASDDWHCPAAENELVVGGQFKATIAAIDGSEQFDFAGTYTEIIPNKKLKYDLLDGRKVEVNFQDLGDSVHVTETFDPETKNPPEVQRAGWQAILNNFKFYTESL